MKMSDKLFIIILIVFLLFAIASLVFSKKAHAGEVHGNLEIGYVPEIHGWMTELEIRYHSWRWMMLSDGIEVLMDLQGWDNSVLSFYPYRDTYYFGTQINITPHLYISLDHSCTHPVVSEWEQFFDKFQAGNRTSYAIGIQW